FAGVPAVREQALGVLAPKGRLVLVGLTDQPLAVADGTRFSYLQQRILGHYGSDMPVALPQLLRLVQSGRLDFAGSISEVLPLARAAEAVEMLNTKAGNPIRLVLRP
ncbi:zinc-binding dehydrogenase, partial [Streptomyces sp. NPDC008121]